MPEVPGETRRQTFARAVVASDLFAKAMVARTWAQLFGAGPVDPWDDLGAEVDAKHPPLLVTLARDFRASGFDVKALLRRMVLSTAYARSSAPAAPGQDDDGAAVRAFARARVRPLAPDTAVSIAAGGHRRRRDGARTPAAAGQQRPAGRAPSLPPSPNKSPQRQGAEEDRALRLVERTLREYRFTFEDDEMADADFDGTLPQALLLLNGEFTNDGTRAADAGNLAAILAATRDPDDRITRMFLVAYTRRPSAAELALFRDQIKAPAAARARPTKTRSSPC